MVLILLHAAIGLILFIFYFALLDGDDDDDGVRFEDNSIRVVATRQNRQ